MSTTPATVRVMTYNVRSLRDDPVSVGRVMRAADPDVVLVQEAPRFARWRSHAAAIARRAGLVAVTGGRTAAGNLLLCHLRLDVKATADVLLTPVPKLHRRGVTLAVVGLGERRLLVAGTHLDLAEPARLQHVAEIRRTMQQFAPGVPFVVGGDLNDRPGSAVFAALSEGAVDAFGAVGEGDGHTFRATAPDRRIDALFVSAGLTPTAAWVADSEEVRRASDHRPLVVDLALG